VRQLALLALLLFTSLCVVLKKYSMFFLAFGGGVLQNGGSRVEDRESCEDKIG